MKKSSAENSSMTEEDRLKLAKKLDSDLDEFIQNLPRKKYEDGWREDEWEEEMAKHPFFMKEPPKPGDKLHPLMEGLQKLKYDPEENEPPELAISYKEDGNFNFKHKNYRLAIVAYTEGIKQKCGDAEIEATLYNNRAAAHYFLKNYRSSLRDCELALKVKPDYKKALNRAAYCCLEILQFNKAIEFCDKLLNVDKSDTEILQLRKKCLNLLKVKERDQRRKETAFKKDKQKEEKLINEILKRGYKLDGGKSGTIELSQLEPCFPELVNHRVYLDEGTNSLIWPVALVYPEYKVIDYIEEFSENHRIVDHLSVVFEQCPEWDQEKKYTLQNLSIYYEDSKGKVVKINPGSLLKDVLKQDRFLIKGGSPSLFIVVKDSEIEKQLLTQ
ncbi:DNA polymerase interacting tetratricopeptide repeat-containing, protein of 47 kDa [Cylas formicarius]|uniref:DNA polymerase interacting tetratricopeptide repeat-containing, protein of 47 kDa n=1 Tax=Cylas formicarius TaxID=197179 RepID=UPI002958A6CB|nr:DNA polymerase interacting tetratricopeptide repeat-containing, protein of 47 kDa [Cylas formicarius]